MIFAKREKRNSKDVLLTTPRLGNLRQSSLTLSALSRERYELKERDLNLSALKEAANFFFTQCSDEGTKKKVHYLAQGAKATATSIFLG
jgi:hypothetical protein